MKPHASSKALAPCSPRRGASPKVATIIKMISLFRPRVNPPCAPSHSLEARGLGNPTPALALRLDVAGEFFGTAAERVDALRPPTHHHLVCGHRLAHGARQLVDDIARRSGRRHEAEPNQIGTAWCRARGVEC